MVGVKNEQLPDFNDHPPVHIQGLMLCVYRFSSTQGYFHDATNDTTNDAANDAANNPADNPADNPANEA